jgi:ABC-type Mn2+/Zn2+ transport system ATPase subunit
MIEVKDVYFSYQNGVEALKGVSLTIKNGEFVAIMGQNGAGKTTLVKHFNGLLKPAKGRGRHNQKKHSRAIERRGLRVPKPRQPTIQRNS